MARPASISDEQILCAAREVFLERGISATTAEIARRAGIAEGSIFKRFPTKRALFHAVLRPEMEAPTWLAQLMTGVGKDDIRTLLENTALGAIDFFRGIIPLIMMAWSNRQDEGPACLPDILSQPDPPPLRALRILSSYFEAEMKLGRLSATDPEILARAFIGGVQNYAFFEVVMRAHDQTPLPAEKYVRGLVDLFLNGAAPTETAPPAKTISKLVRPKKRSSRG
jgi:AcrR family transcriptional regulator